MSTFPDSFDSTRPFDDDDSGYTPPPYSDTLDESSIFNNNPDGDFAPPDPIYSSQSNAVNGVFLQSDGPILPEMHQEGLALREWRRQNAVLLEQKEKREKEILSQIIEEANEYKASFHEKRKVTCENNKSNNREKEKLFLANQEKFHKEVDKNYWKGIAELIPNEVPAIEKKRGKKEQEKKPSIVVVQGPKPGKPTDLARMRQILVKLKHTTPAHLKLTPAAKDVNTPGSVPEPSKPAVASAPEAVVAA